MLPDHINLIMLISRRLYIFYLTTDMIFYTAIHVAKLIFYVDLRQSLLSLHMTKSYVRTATRTTLKVEANLTQILNFKANFHTEFEPFFKKKKLC